MSRTVDCGQSRHPARRAGFTLIELVISVAIVAVLATGAAALLENAVRRAQEAELRADLRQMRQAIDAYKMASDEGRIAHAADATGYPPTLEILATGAVDARSPVRKKIFFLRRIPVDPMASGAEKGWALRSYASDPDDPEPSEDVYDVFSTSTRIGLNGIPYNRW